MGARSPVFLPVITFATAAIVYLARRIPRFLRVLVGMLAAAHMLLLAILLVAASGLVPEALAGYVPPVSTPIGASAFAALIYGLSFVPVIRTIMAIADRYFESRADSLIRVPLFGTVRATEGGIGTMFLAVLIGINLAQVALAVRLNFFSRDLFNSFQDKNADAFWYQLLWIFVPLATVHVAVALTEVYLAYVLRIRWRAFLNEVYVGEWLGGGTHYRLQLSHAEADNPDQRIAEDLRKYVETTYSLSLSLLTQSATLVSFVAILWTISRDFTFPGTDTVVPGLLVWFVIALCGARHVADAPDRPAADPAQLPAGALRGGLSASRWRGCANTPSRSPSSKASRPSASASPAASPTSSATTWRSSAAI